MQPLRTAAQNRSEFIKATARGLGMLLLALLLLWSFATVPASGVWDRIVVAIGAVIFAVPAVLFLVIAYLRWLDWRRGKALPVAETAS